MDDIIINLGISSLYEPFSESLRSIMKTTSHKINVCSSTGQMCGTVTSFQLNYFEFLGKYYNDGKHEDLILDNYDNNMTSLFCIITNSLLFSSLKLSPINVVLMVKIMDDYKMIQDVAIYIMEQIDSYYLTWETFSEITNLYNSKIMGPMMKLLHDKTLIGIENNVNIKLIPHDCFSFAFGRRVICRLLKESNFNNSETKIANELCDKIMESKLSLKAVYDLLSCVYWFNVDQDLIIPKLEVMKTKYLEFNIPKKILSTFTSRTSMIKSYNSKHNSFKFNKKFNLKMRPGTEYSKSFQNSATMHVYTTTHIPTLRSIGFHICNNKVQRHYPSIMVSNFSNTTQPFAIKFSIYHKDETIVTNKTWTFKNKMCIVPISAHFVNDDFEVVIEMVYDVIG